MDSEIHYPANSKYSVFNRRNIVVWILFRLRILARLHHCNSSFNTLLASP